MATEAVDIVQVSGFNQAQFLQKFVALRIVGNIAELSLQYACDFVQSRTKSFTRNFRLTLPEEKVHEMAHAIGRECGDSKRRRSNFPHAHKTAGTDV
jgi:hypothetical protein